MKWAGVAQLVELQPSKLDVASSNLVSRSSESEYSFLELSNAHVAQSVERFLGKEEVHRFDSGRGLQKKYAEWNMCRFLSVFFSVNTKLF